MEPIDFWGALRRSWRLLLVLGILGAVIGGVLPTSRPKMSPLSASPWIASMIVGSSPGGANALGGGITNGQIEFYAGSTPVKQATLQAAGINVPTILSADFISAHPAGPLTKRGQQVQPVVLVAVSNSIDGAVSLVDTYSTQLADFLVNLVSQKQSAKNSNSNSNPTPDSIGYEVLQPAGATYQGRVVIKQGLTSSRKVRIIAGLALGIVLGALIVLARELLDKRIRTADRAESTFGFPVVVEIPGSGRSVKHVERSLDVVNSPESFGAEAYRMLRMSVLFETLAPRGHVKGNGLDLLLGPGLLGNGHAPLGNGHDPATGARTDDEQHPEDLARRQVVLVVSPGVEATRSQVVVNFAAAYAEAGQRAVVISTVELGNGPLGVATGAVSGEVTPEDVERRLEPSRIDRVYGLPLADFVDNSAQLVTRAPAVVDAARSVADVIVVEAPPLLTVHHAEALSRAVDVVLVVGECWTTTFDDARRAGESLRRMEAPVLGVVLTNARVSRRALRHAAAAVRAEPALTAESPVAEAEEPEDQYSVAGATTQTEA
jgi:Mrp family chromosome partitioning ATPase